MIVLDASVILKWIFHDEEGGLRADRIKADHVAGIEIIAVPGLLYYEMGNVLATKTRLSETSIAEAFSLLWGFSFQRFDLGLEEFLSCIALCRKYGITLYDAAYVELAKRLNCKFVTADKKLYERIKSVQTAELL